MIREPSAKAGGLPNVSSRRVWLVVAILIACSPSSAPRGTVATSAPPSASPPASPSTSVTVVVDHRAGPGRWHDLLAIPFGSGPSEVGITDCSDCEVDFPAGLAVARDGSFWLLDEQKERVAHFAPSGALIGAVDVSGRHRGSMTAATMAHGALIVAFSSGRLLKITDEGIRREVTLHIHGLPLYPFSLVTRNTRMYVETVGGAHSGKGYVGYGEVSFEELGLVVPEPGLPLTDGGFLAAVYENRLETLTWLDADGVPTTSRELTVRAKRSEGNRPTNFNLYPTGSTGRGVTGS